MGRVVGRELLKVVVEQNGKGWMEGGGGRRME